MSDPKCEYPMLDVVYTPSGEHKIDIVFAHGLNPFNRDRHPYETWTDSNGVFWPSHLLPDEIPFARIMIYGYNSSVSDPEQMSTARIRDHADTLLNLLDLRRGYQQGALQPKIIFIGHSLGGLVIKQALLNAIEDSKYTSIRTATYGLVFFATPHHGAKGVELGKVAANLAKFVSRGNANNELLNCLEQNSLFTRNMSERFRHQLEDYKVISFIEGRPMVMETMTASVSKVLVERESAVLGLPGLRETQVVVDSNHSEICKLGSKSAKYLQISGNIQKLVNEAVQIQGYIPVRPARANGAPTMTPPSFGSPGMNMQAAVIQPPSFTSPIGSPEHNQIEAGVTGVLYTPIGHDSKSVQIAELKNAGHWEPARRLASELYVEYERSLGQQHRKTLEAAFEMADLYMLLEEPQNASTWTNWVSNVTKRPSGTPDQLYLKAESLRGLVLAYQGDASTANTLLSQVLARQQGLLGDTHLDTQTTQVRLACTCVGTEGVQGAISRLLKRIQVLEQVFGGNHIETISAVLDWIEVRIPRLLADQYGAYQFNTDVQNAGHNLQTIRSQLTSLGPQHPVSLRALRIHGQVTALLGDQIKASEMLHQALIAAEDAFDPNHPITIEIVEVIGHLAVKSSGILGFYTKGAQADQAVSWLKRTLDWKEPRFGIKNGSVKDLLKLLGSAYMASKNWFEAEKCFERLSNAYAGENSLEAQQVARNLQSCKTITGLTRMNQSKFQRQDISGTMSGLLSQLRF